MSLKSFFYEFLLLHGKVGILGTKLACTKNVARVPTIFSSVYEAGDRRNNECEWDVVPSCSVAPSDEHFAHGAYLL